MLNNLKASSSYCLVPTDIPVEYLQQSASLAPLSGASFQSLDIIEPNSICYLFVWWKYDGHKYNELIYIADPFIFVL